MEWILSRAERWEEVGSMETVQKWQRSLIACSRVVFLFVLCGTLQLSARADDAETERFNTIESKLQSWQAQVSFRSTFRYYDGQVAASDINDVFEILDVWEEDTASSIPEISVKANGILNVMRGVSRFRMEFVNPYEIADDLAARRAVPNGGLAVRNSPFDQAVGRTDAFDLPIDMHFQIGGERAGKRFGNFLNVSQRYPAVGFHSPGQSEINLYPTPVSLSPFGISALLMMNSPGQKVAREVISDREGTIQLKMSSETSKSVVARTVSLWTAPRLPAVTEIDWRLYDQNGNVKSQSRTLFEDLVECGEGIYAARKVTIVSKLTGFPLAKVRIFISNDLGSEAPTEADFSIPVPSSARIAGLYALPPLNAEGMREVNIFSLTPDDLEEGREALAEATELSPRQRPRSPLGWILVVANLIALAGIGTFAAFRARRQGK